MFLNGSLAGGLITRMCEISNRYRSFNLYDTKPLQVHFLTLLYTQQIPVMIWLFLDLVPICPGVRKKVLYSKIM